MRRLVIVVMSLGVLLGLSSLAVVNANEHSPSQDHFKVELTGNYRDQMEANEAAGKELERADNTLNEIYNKVLIKYKDNQQFIEKFTQAELEWITFRDAELEAIFPRGGGRKNYGTRYPMAYSIARAELTWDRVKQLNQWIEDTPGNSRRNSEL